MVYGLSVEFILTGAIIFTRVSAMIFALPFFGDSPTPVQIRVLLAVAISFAMYGVVPPGWIKSFPTDVLEFIALILREICIGLFMGFVGRLAFDAIIMAASIVGYQMGFGLADLFMPDVDTQMNSFTAFHRIVMMLIFLSLNLHHMYLDAMARTFSLIPAGAALPSKDLGNFIIEATAGVFQIAIQLGAPVLVALMFANSAMGLLARSVPQINIFTLSFPVGFFIGLFVYMACLPFFPEWAHHHFDGARLQLVTVIKGMTP